MGSGKDVTKGEGVCLTYLACEAVGNGWGGDEEWKRVGRGVEKDEEGGLIPPPQFDGREALWDSSSTCARDRGVG